MLRNIDLNEISDGKLYGINDMVKAASTSKMSDLIFSDMRGQLDALESSIKDKQVTLDRLQRCHDALGRFSA